MTATSNKPDNTGRDSKRLPERIVKAILSQQDTSERLVGWFQLAVVILFGLLYCVSPKTFSADETFTLVPWFLRKPFLQMKPLRWFPGFWPCIWY